MEVIEGFWTRSAGESRLWVGSPSPICAHASRVLGRSETNNLKRSGRNRRQHEQVSQGLPRNQRWFGISANLVRELHNCSSRESVHCLDVYTRSLFMSIVHRPPETDRFSIHYWYLKSFLFWRLSICYRSCIFHSCIFHPCYLLPHFPLLHFPLPHFQRPRIGGTNPLYHLSPPLLLANCSSSNMAHFAVSTTAKMFLPSYFPYFPS